MNKQPYSVENNIDVTDVKISFFSEIVRGKNVLDIGVVQHDNTKADTSTWLHKALCAKAKNILGLDIDHRGVDFLQDKGFKVVYADAQDFHLGKTFEVITAGDLIEHLDNPGGFLECVKEHLKPHGVLVLSTPNPFWWKTWIHVLVKGNSSPHPEHTCWYCECTIAQLLERHGFYIESFEYGTVYILTTFFQKLTRAINTILPVPGRLRHNTMLLTARLRD
jgi:SAM-dependent methyltransferase